MGDDFIKLLVCPVDHQALQRDGDVLVCTSCGRRYPIIDGIPHMIPEDGQENEGAA